MVEKPFLKLTFARCSHRAYRTNSERARPCAGAVRAREHRFVSLSRFDKLTMTGGVIPFALSTVAGRTGLADSNCPDAHHVGAVREPPLQDQGTNGSAS